MTLSELMGGDEARVRRVLRAFRIAANNDLLQLSRLRLFPIPALRDRA